MACSTAESPFKVTDGQILEMMLAHFGILAYVAAALGISRTTIHKRVKNSLPLQQARDEARAAVVLMAENKLLSAIEEGASWAIKFTLNTLGRTEGFGAPKRARKPRAEPGEAPMEATQELDEFRGEIVDSAEMRLIWAIKNSEPWAIKYCLSTLGRSKGYGASIGDAPQAVEPPGDEAQTAAGAPTEGAQTSDAPTVVAPTHGAPTKGAQTLAQPAEDMDLVAPECANDDSFNRGCVSEESANHDSANHGNTGEGAQTLHGSSGARRCDPATRDKRRRERKQRKQRVRENRRQGR